MPLWKAVARLRSPDVVNSHRLTICCAALVGLWIGSPPTRQLDVRADEPKTAAFDAESRFLQGQDVFARKCADCHGSDGQGVEGVYADPLVGDESIGELARRITATMPEGEPEECVGEEAAAVAAYIHQAFYSEAARVRNRPPRIALTHLTANQLRQSLADLYAHFAGTTASVAGDRGLRGHYFKGARIRSSNRKIDRVDDVIDFDWKHDGPGEEISAEDFCVQWRGGLLVNETGPYEIVIRSTCAFTCDLGRIGREFINNRVQSGNRTEFRKSIVLTAGRVVPIEIELYQRKRKTKQPPARISLSWVPSGGVERVISARHLLPTTPPPAFSLQAKLPPDDRSYGYDRGLAIDRQWDDSTTAAAVEFAQVAVDELWADYRRSHKKDADGNRGLLRMFLKEVAETAFRGPLDETARQFYVEEQLARSDDDNEAIKRSLLVILKSPRFLYPGLDRDRSVSQQVANRLALTMFDSLPADDWLIRLIRQDALEDANQVRTAAARMMSDYRTRGKTRQLMQEWLHLSGDDQITKSAESFPEFDAELVDDLRASLNAFVDDVVWSDSSDYRRLFLADWTYTTPRLEAFYGSAWQPSADGAPGLSKTNPFDGRRIGLLSHPYLMSRLAYQDSTSPVHRGVFLIRYVLGRTLRPPQDAFTPLSPDLHPNMTTRQRVELQTSPEGCQVCHYKINGLGFALERFDAVGRYRETEGEQPIDSTGHYTTRGDEQVRFNGAAELAEFLASSDDAHRAFVNRAFQHFVKQPIAAYGPDRLDRLTEHFRNNNYHIRKLLVEIALIAADPAQFSDKSLTSEES